MAVKLPSPVSSLSSQGSAESPPLLLPSDLLRGNAAAAVTEVPPSDFVAKAVAGVYGIDSDEEAVAATGSDDETVSVTEDEEDEKESDFSSFLLGLDPFSESTTGEIEERLLTTRFPDLYEGFIAYVLFKKSSDYQEDPIYLSLMEGLLSGFISEAIEKFVLEKRVDFSKLPFISGAVCWNRLQTALADCFKDRECPRAKLAICKAIAICEQFTQKFQKVLEVIRDWSGKFSDITYDSIETAPIQFIQKVT